MDWKKLFAVSVGDVVPVNLDELPTEAIVRLDEDTQPLLIGVVRLPKGADLMATVTYYKPRRAAWLTLRIRQADGTKEVAMPWAGGNLTDEQLTVFLEETRKNLRACDADFSVSMIEVPLGALPEEVVRILQQSGLFDISVVDKDTKTAQRIA
jgi:hypothetical protein